MRIRINALFVRTYADSSPDQNNKLPDQLQFPEYNKKTYGADVKKFSQLPLNFGANQHITIDNTLKEKLRGILWKFKAPIRYAFAYGSGVFEQAGADAKIVFQGKEDIADCRYLWWISFSGCRMHNIGMVLIFLNIRIIIRG